MADALTCTPEANGPLVCRGTVYVKLPDGTRIVRTGEFSFCRCGHSADKPFCDGSHRRVGFTADALAGPGAPR
jgi:CDGSH-type Zn-finger protein